MGVVLMGVIWVWLAMIWAWTGGVTSVLELVFKKLEPMQTSQVILFGHYKICYAMRGNKASNWLLKIIFRRNYTSRIEYTKITRFIV